MLCLGPRSQDSLTTPLTVVDDNTLGVNMADLDSVPNLRELSRNACISCRSKKVRCLQGSVEGTCERCRRIGAVCEQPPPRGPRKPKAPRPSVALPEEVANRIKRLEQSLEHVTSELAASHHKSHDFSTDADHPHSMHSSPAGPAAHSTPGDSHSSGRTSDPDILDRGLISREYADALVEEFRIMAKSFPFVVIPEVNVVAAYKRTNPMLLLAMFCVASWRDRALQSQIDHDYLKRIGAMMVTDGEQSLDVLQSLIVYIAWCHWYGKSTYRLNFFTASIVVNLGINRQVQRGGSREKMRMNFDFDPKNLKAGSSQSIPAEWPAEAKRAYIGSYVISRSYSLILRRSNTLQYNETLEQYALQLAQDNLAPSDSTLIHYVRLLRHAETVCDTFNYADSPSAQQFPEERLQFIVKSLDTQLDKLWSSIPLSLAGDMSLGYTHLSFHAYTHEISLHTIIPGHNLSTFQTNLLISCLTGVKSILDLIGSISDRQLQSMLGYNWARLHYLFHLAMELTLSVDSPSWDITMVRQVLPLELYIDEFCEKIDRNALQISGERSNGNWFDSVATNWRKLRHQYMSELVKRGIVVPQQQQAGMVDVRMGGGDAGQYPPPNGFQDFGNVDFMPPWYGAPQVVGSSGQPPYLGVN